MHLTFVVILALIPTITTLKCYVCNSNENEKCADPASLVGFERECSAQLAEPHCRTITQTVNEQKSVVRSCGSKATSKTCYKTAGINSATVCSCGTALCNHASNFNRQQQIMTIVSSMILIGIAMIMFR